MSQLTRLRRNVVLLLAITPLLTTGAVPALGAGDVTVELFSELPIADTENPCGSAVGSATGKGVIRTHGEETTTLFKGRFHVDLTGNPIPNAWDDAATTASGHLTLRIVESPDSFELFLRVRGTTDTGVMADLVQKLRAGPNGGAMRWNCFDGNGPQQLEF